MSESFQVSEQVTMLPVISVGQHGTGEAYASRSAFDTKGRLVWEKSPRGYISHTSYDDATGKVVQRVEDVQLEGTALQPPPPTGWQTPADGGLDLVTDYVYDNLQRVIRELGPSHPVQLDPSDTSSTIVRTAVLTQYRDSERQVWSAQGYDTGTPGDPAVTTVGPINIAVLDAAGRPIEEINIDPSSSAWPPVETTIPARSAWLGWTVRDYDQWGRLNWQRSYHEIPPNGNGSSPADYDQIDYHYDSMGRVIRTTDATGTIDATVYDSRGLTTSRWTGTNATGATPDDPTGGGTAGNNMVMVEVLKYDTDGNPSDAGGGAGLLKQQRLPVDGTGANDRVTNFTHDYRHQIVTSESNDGTRDLILENQYDNLGRVVTVTRYKEDIVSDDNYLGRSVTRYDAAGQVFQSEVYGADPSSGALTQLSLTSKVWYDADGNPIKRRAPGSDAAEKLVYDGIARGIKRYVVLEDTGPHPSSSSSSSSGASSSPSSSSSSSSSSGSSSSSDPDRPSSDSSASSSSSSSSSSSGSSSSSSAPEPSSSGSAGGIVPNSTPDETKPSNCQNCHGDEVQLFGAKPVRCTAIADNQIPDPVLYATGQMNYLVTDLRSSGFGFEWGHSRGYTNRLHGPTDSPGGQHWFVNQLSYLVFNAGESGDRIAVVSGTDTSLWFVPDGSGGWLPEFSLLTQLVLDPVSGDYVLTLPSGRKRNYFSNIAANGAALSGRLKSLTNPDGTVATLGYDAGGRLTEFSWSDGNSSASYVYAYYEESDGAALAGRYRSVTRKLDDEDVERACYDFHTGSDDFGSAGDLKTATVEEWDSSAEEWIQRRANYYRYYKTTATAERGGQTVVIGFKHGLKYILSSEGLEQMVADGRDPYTALDEHLAPYADNYFEYNSDKRITLERVRGGDDEYTLSYLTAAVDPGFEDKNTWYRKTTATFPDGTTRTVYSTRSGQIVLSKLENAAKTRSWFRGYHYDSGGRIDIEADPDAINNALVVEPSSPTGTLTIALWPHAGRVQSFVYYNSTDPSVGSAAGFMEHHSVQEGEHGNPVVITKYHYGQHTVGDYSLHPLVRRIDFPTAGMPESQAPATNYQFIYHGGGSAGSTGSTPVAEIELNPNNDPSSDKVYEQLFLEYDDASNPTYATSFQRFHDAVGTGPLGGPIQSVKPKGRRSYLGRWPDGIGRPWAAADFGTDGGADLPRPALAPTGSTHPHALVTLTEYGNDGLPDATIDPVGRRSEWTRNKVGRRTEFIENVSATTAADTNRTTMYRYEGGFLRQLILINADTNTNPPTTSDEQITEWDYGSDGALISSNRLLNRKAYPGGDHIDYSDYNRQGQPGTVEDSMGERALDYDKFGRLVHDRAINPASGTDQGVLRLTYTFHPTGQLDTATSYDHAAEGTGTAVNQVALDYDAFGNLAWDYQAHGGVVDKGTTPGTGTTPEVHYTFEDGANNTTRRKSIRYPGGRTVHFGYQPGTDNDRLSRVMDLTSGVETSPFVSYTYIGLLGNVRTRYNIADAELSLISSDGQPGGDAGDPYTGIDRFGRLIDLRWLQTSDPSRLIDRPRYTYDKASRRKNREVDLSGVSGQDQAFTYDGLSQLKTRELGDLSGGQIGGIPKQKETWTFDPTGNWNRYLLQDINQAGTSLETTLDQSRVHNAANQITQIDGSSSPVAYHGGNATKMPPDAAENWSEAYTQKWDAWSRLVKVTDDDDNTVATYAYDAFNFRTTKTVGTSAPRHSYYDFQWRPVEERPGSQSATPDRLYLWGARSRYDLVRQEGDGPAVGSSASSGSGMGSGSSSGSGPVSPLYFAYDAMDPIAAFTAGANVEERYRFSGFGRRQVMAADFSKRSDSLHGVEFAFHSEFLDPETGQYNYGYRYYSPATGRWPSRDPIGESGGEYNLYRFSFNDAPNWWDFLGLINLTFSGNGKCGRESVYLNEYADDIFGGAEGDKFTNIGSERSRGWVKRTLGISGHIDANKRGREMSGLLCNSDDKVHNVLAHSAGVYNAVEGITKFAKDCCCDKGEITINLLLIAPKIAPRIVRSKLMEAMKDCPGLSINIRLYYDSRDSKIPRHGWPVKPGNWQEDILVTPEEKREGTGSGPFASFSEEEISQDPTKGIHDVHGFTAALGIDRADGGTDRQRDMQRQSVLRFLNRR